MASQREHTDWNRSTVLRYKTYKIFFEYKKYNTDTKDKLQHYMTSIGYEKLQLKGALSWQQGKY